VLKSSITILRVQVVLCVSFFQVTIIIWSLIKKCFI